jgi:hypothetical protein
MTVVVPLTEKTGLVAKAAEITALTAVPSTSPAATFAAQRLNQVQIEEVNALLDQRKLTAVSIISTIPVANKSNALYAKIAAQNTLITAYGATAPAGAANQVLDQLQRQLVQEEMISGARTAASILSTMSYVGGAAV